jgi:RNA-directed DNA polymerase
VVDRVVQQAVVQVLEPIFEPTFHPSSHRFRPNRGAHTAIAETKGYLEAGYQTVVDFDLAKFSDHVHHQRLSDRIAQRVTDQRIITLIRRMLTASVVMPDGTKLPVEAGTPRGGPLSPRLSSIVLDELDQELARRGHRFVRHAGDADIFVRSERAGQRVMTSIRGVLVKRMRLQVKEAKSGVRKPDEVHFLGFRFHCKTGREGGDVAIHPSAKAEQRLRTTIREMTPPNWGRSIRTCRDNVSRYTTGWMSHDRLCTPEAVQGLGVIDPSLACSLAHIRRRIRPRSGLMCHAASAALRAIVVRQRKRQRFLYRHLKAKGVSSKAAASCAYCGTGAWVKSNRPAMTRACPPRWFTSRMASLKARWHDLNPPQVSDQLALEF